MKRPGPVGVLIGLAFAIPVVIELRTVLAFLGVHIDAGIYYPIVAAVLVVAAAVILLAPERGEPGNPNEAT